MIFARGILLFVSVTAVWLLYRAYTGVREVSPGALFVVYTGTAESQTSKYRTATFDTVGRTVVVKQANR